MGSRHEKSMSLIEDRYIIIDCFDDWWKAPAGISFGQLSIDISNWDTSKVTDMAVLYNGKWESNDQN